MKHLLLVILSLVAAGTTKAQNEQSSEIPLVDAALKGNAEQVRRLVRATNIESIDPYLGTALMAASMNGHLDVVRMLLSAGADVNRVHIVDNEAIYFETTALEDAATGGHAEVVYTLLKAGANPYGSASRENCSTPLSEAMNGGHDMVVGMLLGIGASFDFNRADYGSGQELLDYECKAAETFVGAASAGYTWIVNYMIAGGAHPNLGVGYKYEWTPLLAASKNGHSEIVGIMLRLGADPNSMDSNYSALCHAISGKHADVAVLLLEAGSSKEDTQCEGGNLFELASQMGDSRVLNLLQGTSPSR